MSEMPVKHFRTKSKVDGNILISKENKQIVTAHGGSVCGNDLNAVPDRPQPVYLWADENDGIRRNHRSRAGWQMDFRPDGLSGADGLASMRSYATASHKKQ